MTTTQRITLAIAALSVVATGCSSADVAATVNGSDIPESAVLGIRVGAADEISVSAEQYRNDLSRLIFTASMATAAEADFGMTDLDTPEGRETYLATASTGEREYLQSISDDPTLTEAAGDFVITQLLLRSKVREALASDEDILVDVWQNDRNALVEVCASHVLVGTEAEALDVLARLEAGEDMGVVAAEVSLDTTSPGGGLPCPISPALFVEPFAVAVANAPVGEYTEPVETEFGFHVILVESRDLPRTLEELAADPLRWVPGETIDFYWNAWINDVVDRADIKVRSDIGMWYPPVDGIIPPDPSP